MKARNRRLILLPISILCLVVLISCRSTPPQPTQGEEAQALNTLSEQEILEGWTLLFDGSSFDGWRGLGREVVPVGHWKIEDGAIKKIPSGEVPLQEDGQPLAGGDLLTEKTFGHFELKFEWKISEAGNSGIKYNVSEIMSTDSPPVHAALGFEYQILDDAGHPDAKNGDNRTAAALYDIISPQGKVINPVGEFNSGRIVFNGNHGEHWLNGVKVLEYDLGTEDMDRRLAASKYKTIPGFEDRRTGHIVLQDHTDAVWYRNIKIRIFKSEGEEHDNKKLISP
ncbi:DUF1080 domain-containing protein [Acidobacteriota bacterium]